MEQLLANCREPKRQVRLCYEIWRLDPEQEVHRQDSASGYHALYATSPNAEYRRCYQELTGDELPPPPALPDLPEIVKLGQVDVEALLLQVDQILTELDQE